MYKQVHWPGKMETPAVLSSLIFLICAFLFLLPSLYDTMILAHHGAPSSALPAACCRSYLAAAPHTHLAAPLNISQRRSLYLWPYPERGLLLSQASFLVCPGVGGPEGASASLSHCQVQTWIPPVFLPPLAPRLRCTPFLLKRLSTDSKGKKMARRCGTPRSPKVESEGFNC